MPQSTQTRKPQLRERKRADGTLTYSPQFEVWHNGQRRNISAGTFTDRAQAEAAWWGLFSKYANSAEAIKEAHAQLTLAQWADRWLELIERNHEVKAGTVDTYRWRLNNWVLPHFDGKTLAELDQWLIRRWVTSLPLASVRSKKAALTTLSACLQRAKEEGYLTDNPARGVELKQSRAVRAAQDEEDVRVWTEAEAQQLLASVAGTPLAVVFALGLQLGLRRGEILGLHWEDVNWLQGKVKIRRNVVATPSRLLTGETTKSGKSRTLPLPAAVTDALMNHRLRLEAADASWKPSGPVVTGFTPRGLQYAVERAVKAAGVPVLSMHAMRHTCASVLLTHNVPPKAVAAFLGHSLQTLLKYYSHWLPDDDSAVVDALNRTYGKNLASPSNPIQTGDPLDFQSVEKVA